MNIQGVMYKKMLLVSLFCLFAAAMPVLTYADVKAVRLFDYEGQLKPVTTCKVSGETKVIAPGPYDKTLRIWDFVTGECEGIVGHHEGYVRSVAACVVDGKIKVIAGYSDSFNDSYKTSSVDLSKVNGSNRVNNTIRVWDLQTGKCEQALRRHLSPATAVATCVVDGKTKILSGSGYYNEENGDKGKYKYGDIHTWDLQTGKCEHTLRGHVSTVDAVATCMVDGKAKLLSGSSDKTVRIWDAQTGACEQVLQGHEDAITSVASCVVDSEIKIVSGSRDGVVRIWDLQTGQCEHVCEGPVYTNCMIVPAVLAGKAKLIVGFQSRRSPDKDSDMLTIWDVQTGRCQHTIPMVQGQRFDSVFTFIANNKLNIAMGFTDGVIIYL